MKFTDNALYAFRNYIRFFVSWIGLQVIVVAILNIVTAKNMSIINGEGDFIKIVLFSLYLLFLFLSGYVLYYKSIQSYYNKITSKKDVAGNNTDD